MNPLPLPSPSVTELAETGVVEVRQRMEPQPLPIDKLPLYDEEDHETPRPYFVQNGVLRQVALFGSVVVDGPWIPGQEYKVLEPWAQHYNDYLFHEQWGFPASYLYMADYPNGISDTHDFGLFEWQEADTMPLELSRHTVRCSEVRVELSDGVWFWVGRFELAAQAAKEAV